MNFLEKGVERVSFMDGIEVLFAWNDGKKWFTFLVIFTLSMAIIGEIKSNLADHILDQMG